MPAMHFQLGTTERGAPYVACGADCCTSMRRSATVNATTDPAAVTCKRCLRSRRVPKDSTTDHFASEIYTHLFGKD